MARDERGQKEKVILQVSATQVTCDKAGEGGCGPSPAEILLLKRRKVRLLQERAALTKNFGLLNYRPLEKQDKFHRAGKFRKRLVSAGNRFGKTTLGCAEDCAWLYGERVWYAKDDEARTAGIPRRPVKGLVIAIDWEKVDELWTSERGDTPGKLWTMLPHDFVKSKRRNHAGAICEVECTNGSVLRFDTVKSWMSNPLGLESSDWDFIHVDEPCPEKMYSAAARGLVDRGGSSWFTLTPLREPWITDLFYPRNLDRKKLPDELVQKDRWSIRGTMHDNITLSKEGVNDYLSSLPQQERECRELGIPLELAGLIYKEFDWDRHVLKDVPQGWSSFNSPPLNYSIYVAIDPHPAVPHMVLFLAVDEGGRKFLYDEIFLSCKINELCEMLHAKSTALTKDGLKDRHIIRILCDPTIYVNNPVTGENIESEFVRHGVFVEKASKALSQGILRVQEELKREDNIYVAPNLAETLYEFQAYCWDEDKGKPVDKDDHAMECLYRLLIDNPVYIPPPSVGSNSPAIELEIGSPSLESLDDDTIVL